MNRFEAILTFARQGHMLFDLCCDHGNIGLSALRISRNVCFVDQSEPALAALRRDVLLRTEAEQSRISILPIPAEQIELPSESCDIVIAGVGVKTTIEILEAMLPDGLGEHRLILCPTQHALGLRKYLLRRGFPLVDECVVKEKGRFREIIVVEKGGQEVSLTGNFHGSRDDILSREFQLHYMNYDRQYDLMKTRPVTS